MIARVEQDNLEITEKLAPEPEIAIDRKAVAVADDEPRPAGIAVPARADCRAGGAGYVKCREWFWRFRDWPLPD
jgi:hypothetical protein